MQNIKSRIQSKGSDIIIRMNDCTPLVDNELHKYINFMVFSNLNADVKWNILWLIKNNLEYGKYMG